MSFSGVSAHRFFMRRIIDGPQKEEVMNRLLSGLLIAAAASLFPSAPKISSAPVDLSIEIAPVSSSSYELLRQRRADTYSCTATLIDSSTNIRGEVIIRSGEEQTTTTTSHGVQMTLKGRVDAARTRAIADVTVMRDGVLVAHQQSRVTLSRTGRTPVY